MNIRQAIRGIVILAITSAASFAGTFGEYNAGDTFALKVVQRETNRVFASGRVVKGVPVPTGVPSFVRGQTVRFRIGARGQLIATGMSIPFVKSMSSPGYTTSYFLRTAKGVNSATVHKLTSRETDFAQVTFVRQAGSGANSSVVSVSYALEKRP